MFKLNKQDLVNVTIASVFTLFIITVIIVIGIITAPNVYANVWHDDFQDSSINTTLWATKFSCDVGTCAASVSETGGYLRIYAQADSGPGQAHYSSSYQIAKLNINSSITFINYTDYGLSSYTAVGCSGNCYYNYEQNIYLYLYNDTSQSCSIGTVSLSLARPSLGGGSSHTNNSFYNLTVIDNSTHYLIYIRNNTLIQKFNKFTCDSSGIAYLGLFSSTYSVAGAGWTTGAGYADNKIYDINVMNYYPSTGIIPNVTIQQSSINFTSGFNYDDVNNWKSDINYRAYTWDNTPTIAFQLNASATGTCVIGNTSGTTDYMLNNYGAYCAETNSNSHTCTLNYSLPYGNNTIYINCNNNTAFIQPFNVRVIKPTTLNGVVKNESNVLLNGTTIIAENFILNTTYTTYSNTSGRFMFSNLSDIGYYFVTVFDSNNVNYQPRAEFGYVRDYENITAMLYNLNATLSNNTATNLSFMLSCSDTKGLNSSGYYKNVEPIYRPSSQTAKLVRPTTQTATNAFMQIRNWCMFERDKLSINTSTTNCQGITQRISYNNVSTNSVIINTTVYTVNTIIKPTDYNYYWLYMDFNYPRCTTPANLTIRLI